ncbi:hypothetical protein [Ralstonia chuxiongensis]|uniref:hypothetical protein n=1 Tax=Ralstonia chuxiongensis TaxID=2957504 RepID=UPI0028F625DF|nr:hypothetical protein [Ralstonia chuxiongensis]CAJ0782350.1 hypothetical protein R8510_04993 [Ralstonia chuxiongensis]
MRTEELIERARKYGLTHIVEGTEYWHAGLFLLLAGMRAYAPDDTDHRERARETLQVLLHLAERYGFAQGPALRYLFGRSDCGERTFLLCKVALSDVPAEDLTATLTTAGFDIEEVFRD